MTLRGAFVDAHGVRWDSNFPDYEGWLAKKSKWMGEWRKRYFILKGSKLFFAKSPKDAPHGMIDIVDCINVKSVDKKTRKNNALLITLKDEDFYLCAESDEMKDEWITKLGKAILHHSSMYSRNSTDDFDSSDLDIDKLQNK